MSALRIAYTLLAFPRVTLRSDEGRAIRWPGNPISSSSKRGCV